VGLKPTIEFIKPKLTIERCRELSRKMNLLR